MTALEFLTLLRSQNIRVWAEGDQLGFRAPRGALTPALRKELAERKIEILAFLRDVEASQAPLLPTFRQGNLPLSFAQARLWFLDQFEPDSPLYNVPSAFRVTGALDALVLEQSLNAIIERHEVLRTTFSAVEGIPYQVIAPAMPLALPVVDLGVLPETEREAEGWRLLREEAKQPFNLATGPLVRGRLIRMSSTEHLLLLNMHHIVSDEWSTGVMLHELSSFYEAYRTGTPSRLGVLPVQYADYAVWQREWLAGKTLEDQLSYWKEKLAGTPASIGMPTDHPRPARQTHRGAYESRRLLSAPQLRRLKALSRHEDATLFMTLLAAFKVLLFRYTGAEDIVVGSPVANRNRNEVEELIGFFVNTLVLRTDMSGNPTFREALGRVRQVALESYAHQDLPFERLVAELVPERNLSHSPLFQVMFLLLEPAEGQAMDFCGLSLEPLEVDSGTAKFELTLFAREEKGELGATLEYNTDLFESATVRRMLGHLQTLLEGIVDDPDLPISVLPLLTGAECRQLLVEWNSTQAGYSEVPCVHHLFENQMERTPGALAALFEGQSLTYGDLNARANQLAHYLHKHDVGPETLVGICVERSLDMVVGVLGILKAGGAYVPLDLSLPQQRLAFMLQDSRVPVLLTQERLLHALPEHRAKVIRLDTDWQAIAQESEENPDQRGLSVRIWPTCSTPQALPGCPKGWPCTTGLSTI